MLFECCCCDCQKGPLVPQDRSGPPPPHMADVVHYPNILMATEGRELLRCFTLQNGFPSRCNAPCCWTPLVADNPAYEGKRLAGTISQPTSRCAASRCTASRRVARPTPEFDNRTWRPQSSARFHGQRASRGWRRQRRPKPRSAACRVRTAWAAGLIRQLEAKVEDVGPRDGTKSHHMYRRPFPIRPAPHPIPSTPEHKRVMQEDLVRRKGRE